VKQGIMLGCFENQDGVIMNKTSHLKGRHIVVVVVVRDIESQQ